MDFLVNWEIEIKADNPIEAAKAARAAQIDSLTRSTVFQVYGEGLDNPVRVDLTAIAEGIEGLTFQSYRGETR